MADMSGFPYFEVEFTKDGEVSKQAEVDALVAGIAGPAVTDVLVISHGWNNDMADARALYADLLGHVRSEVDAGRPSGVAGRSLAVLAVLWPSKKFAERELIAGGAAAVAGGDAEIRARIDELRRVFGPEADAALDTARKLAPDLEARKDARDEFAQLIRGLVSPDAKNDEDASNEFFRLSGDELFDRLSKPILPAPGNVAPGIGRGADTGGAADVGGLVPPAGGGAPGGAAGLGSFVSGVWSGARNLLNFTTYYAMKARAGTVGSKGLNQVLSQVHAARGDLRLHLVGHSFGCRVVTSSIGPGAAKGALVQPDSMTLLQAAFSHYGFADDYDGKGHPGFFRQVVGVPWVRGPIVVTFTKNDRAVGLAYPIASLLAGQNASAIGDANDPYGGLGRNGAQKTTGATTGPLGKVDVAYALASGRIANLNADAYIRDHSDICHDEVVHAMLSAITA